MTIYLDTSALIPLHVDEPSSVSLASMVGKSIDLPMLSNYGVGEFSAVVSRYVRMALMSPPQAKALLADFDAWLPLGARLIDIAPHDLARATAIARQFDLKLRFPDALHVAICDNRAMTLVTRDRQMAVAAKMLHLTVVEFD